MSKRCRVMRHESSSSVHMLGRFHVGSDLSSRNCISLLVLSIVFFFEVASRACKFGSARFA